jgi:hypothetical protein
LADDLDGPCAERRGYVNRLIADDKLDAEVHRMAVHLAQVDPDAIMRTKSYLGQYLPEAVKSGLNDLRLR